MKNFNFLKSQLPHHSLKSQESELSSYENILNVKIIKYLKKENTKSY